MSTNYNINNLEKENSIYLKSHAEDKIHWQSFSKEVLLKAKEENKPLFLSIGYLSNYLCHVTQEESFLDDKLAQKINDHFIAIKIDKDEYPEVSHYFQLASQVSSNKGGWPINAFSNYELKPLFATTYISNNEKDPNNFSNSIENFLDQFEKSPNSLTEKANSFEKILSAPAKASEKLEFEGEFPLPTSIFNALKNYQDNENGGYGAAPKLINLPFYEYAIEQILEGMLPEEFSKHVVESIEQMLMGGVYDHAKGGIHPFSRDDKWLVPNFEKHIGDQAALLRVLVKSSLIYPSPLIYDSIIQTLDYLESEMLSDENFFFTSQASYSEGVDGLYFNFSEEEFEDAIVDFDENLSDQIDDIKDIFNITKEGNFSKDLNVISLNYNLKDSIYPPEKWDVIRKVKMALMEARKDRIPPMTDSKGIASYNFQVLSSLIDIIQYSNIEIISKSAFKLLEKTFEPIHKKFISIVNGKSTIQNSNSIDRQEAIFDNYVALLDVTLRFYEISGNEQFLKNAEDTFHFIQKNFYQNGGFCLRSIQKNDLINIQAPIFDQPQKSPVSNYIFNVRKWSMKLDIKFIEEELQDFIFNLKHLSLQNPIAFGETLRALTYPKEAFKVIEVPRKWIETEKIQAFYPRFSSRFAITYTDFDGWLIKNAHDIELQGKDFESFKETFKSE